MTSDDDKATLVSILHQSTVEARTYIRVNAGGIEEALQDN